ncbi:hypothetical protein [Siphonobacter sp.]|uniref:hypothetical protein n=1 Tax=Siphonobacter sp. TaxID=1869184 RepID=UPI003B3AD332
MRLPTILPILLSILLLNLLSCTKEHEITCKSVSEDVDERANPEPFHRDSLRIFTFEHTFDDSLSIVVDNQVEAKGRVGTDFSLGMAKSFSIKAQSGQMIRIQTSSDCASFSLKDGYKYLYINRNNGKWKLTYSNVARGYL